MKIKIILHNVSHYLATMILLAFSLPVFATTFTFGDVFGTSWSVTNDDITMTISSPKCGGISRDFRDDLSDGLWMEPDETTYGCDGGFTSIDEYKLKFSSPVKLISYVTDSWDDGDESFIDIGTSTNNTFASGSNDNVSHIFGNQIIVPADTDTIVHVYSAVDAPNDGSAGLESITINDASQTINFDALVDQTCGESFDVNASSNRGLDVSYSSSGSCTVSSNEVTTTDTGSCTITASQSGTSDYVAASESQAFTINKGNQTITFNSLSNKNESDPPFSISATASSGLSVSFNASGNCTISDTSVTLTGGGSCIITASQSGNTCYEAATNIQQQFDINNAPTFTSTAITSINQDTLYTYDITTNDADTDDTLTITALTLPTWLSLTDNSDGTATLTGTATESGTHNVTLQVSDGTVNVDQSFTITVLGEGHDCNDVVTLNDITNEDSTGEISAVCICTDDSQNTDYNTIVISEVEYVIATSSLKNQAHVTQCQDANDKICDDNIPSSMVAGTTYYFKNTDGAGYYSCKWSTSGFTNGTFYASDDSSPTFTSTAITSVDKDTLYTYDIITNDADTDDTLTITAPTLPTWLSLTDNGDDTATLTGTATESGIHNLTLQVSDGTVNVDQSFTITVNESLPNNALIPPTVLNATAISQTQINLSWTDNSNDETGFKVERDGVVIQTTEANATSYNDIDLTCDTTYNYSVKATNATGDSTDNSASTTTMACATSPIPPTDFNATAISQTQINLSWTDNSNDETGFKIERDGVVIQTTEANITSYNDTGLTCGTTYNYSVKASNATGDSTVVTASTITSTCTDDGDIAIDPSSSEIFIAPLPTGGNISGSFNIGGQTFTDDTVIGKNASVSNVIFEGNVENKGLISNSTIASNTTLSGGKLTGNITNEGTIADVDFVGTELNGGILAGIINNNSQVDGIISNVHLADDTSITGGKVGGHIKCLVDGVTQNVQLTDGTSIIGCDLVGEIDGTENGQAKIGNGKIESGTILSHVCLTPTVQYDPNTVTLGDGVITPTNFDNPTPQDFCISLNQILRWNSGDVIGVEDKAFNTFDAKYTANIPMEAVNAILSSQLSEFTKNGLSGITKEQFSYLLVNSLTGLTSKNMAGFSPEVIDQFALPNLNALDTEQFQNMKSQDVSKLFTNFDGEKITPADVESLVPADWQVDLETGVITAPDKAKLALRALPTPDLPAIELPEDMVDLNAGFGLGGAGTPMVDELADTLITANLSTFTPTQTETGIFQVNSPEMNYSFIPDVDDISKANLQEEPVGLSIGTGGFYQLTTPNAIQIPFIPAPKSPIALSEATGSKIKIGKRGDVMMKSFNRTRSTDVYLVAIFDPFIEEFFPDDLCIEIRPGELECDNEGLRRGVRVKTRKILYSDGTAQTIRPTVLSPDIFIEEILKFENIDQAVYNSDGTFSVLYQGKPHFVHPNFTIKNERVSEPVEPNIDFNEDGSIKYGITIETKSKTRSTDVYEILFFDLFFELAPNDLCIEIMPGELECDF
ncbi:cadherin-like domain-containing protein [Candidatus Halobeggiatoa sp. HSG11]|nr:cadherin-like domain-containing protein [Candidatus Halobeggiatoa sp. HSG11]